MNARIIGWVALGVVLGFVSGQALGRRELHEVERERAALEQQLREAERPNLLGALFSRLEQRAAEPEPAQQGSAAGVGDAGVGVRASEGVLHAPSARGDVAVIGAVEAPAERAREQAPPAVEGPAVEPGAAPLEPVRTPEERQQARRERFRRRLEQFDSLAATQRARALASRSALIAQARLSPEQVAVLDGTVKDMNDKLVGYGEEVIDQATSEQAPRPAEVLGLGHDVSGILFDGQQKLDALVGERAAEVDGSAREIWNYIDLEQWRPFAAQKLAEGEAAGGAAAPAPQAPGAAGNSGARP